MCQAWEHLLLSIFETGLLPGLSLDPRGTKWVSYTVSRADLTCQQKLVSDSTSFPSTYGQCSVGQKGEKTSRIDEQLCS
jgi:hypothetical protein